MNPKIKPIVYFCISAALWAILSYYLSGTLAGALIFYIFGTFPAFFLQLCMFLPPIEKWVRYVPVPGILSFGIIELLILMIQKSLSMQTLLAAVLFIAPFLIGFAAAFIYHALKSKKNKT